MDGLPGMIKNAFFETKVLNMETKKLDRHYFKILSIRTDKHGCVMGFKTSKM